MPVFIAAIGGMLLNIVGSMVGRVLVALGLSVVTYTGISTTLDWLKGQAVTALIGVPPQLMGIIGILKVGQCISIIVSAILARAIVQGLNSDSVKKWVLK